MMRQSKELLFTDSFLKVYFYENLNNTDILLFCFIFNALLCTYKYWQYNVPSVNIQIQKLNNVLPLYTEFIFASYASNLHTHILSVGLFFKLHFNYICFTAESASL